MIPSKVDYHRPSSLAEAIQLLNDHADSKILAGGHSLIPLMKLRLNEPASVVSIGELAELKGISEHSDRFSIGAATTHAEIGLHAGLKQQLSLIVQAANSIGDIQVRNFGTIGGSIAHADPAADWPGALLAAEATINVTNPDGNRQIPAIDFFQGFFTTALKDGEIITSIDIPKPPPQTRSTYKKFAQPASRFAIVGCAVMLTGSPDIKKAAIAFNGVGDSAFRDKEVETALEGKSLNSETIEQAAQLAGQGVEVLSDYHASAEYRLHLSKVYAQRALKSLI